MMPTRNIIEHLLKHNNVLVVSSPKDDLISFKDDLFVA